MNPYPTAASGEGGGIALALLLVVGLYFLPSIVALVRQAPDRGSALVINLFLGWTVVGWVCALAIASRSRVQPIVINQSPFPITPSAPPVGPRAGWYPDPTGAPALERFWDGRAWTSTTRRTSVPPGRRA